MTDDRVEKFAEGFSQRQKKMLERSGAAMWATILAHVTAEAFSRRDTVTRDELIAAVKAWAAGRTELHQAGSNEAIKRLLQPTPEGHDEKG